jgi:Domain of unknown function (DUF4956)
MRTAIIFAIDLVAVLVLVYGIYVPRHLRHDLAVALVAVNLAVLTVVAVLLTSTNVGTGLGLGLFGVLSLIRLRSTEINHDDVAYMAASLAMGLVAGARPQHLWIVPVAAVSLLAVLFVIDHPRAHGGFRQHLVTLDHAYPHEADLRNRLTELLDAEIAVARVVRLDLVNDTTVVDVRFRPKRK